MYSEESGVAKRQLAAHWSGDISVRGGGPGGGSPPTLEKFSKISPIRANVCP